MHNFSSFLLCAILIGGLSAPAMAQSTEYRKEYSPEKRVEELKKNLSLTDDQVSQIKDILTQSTADKPKTREERGKRFKEVESKITAILTPDQKTKYDVFKEELKSKHKAEFHAKAMERIKNELKLTDDQSEKVSKILGTYQDDIMNVIKSDPKISDSKAQFNTLRNRRNEALEAVLSPDQMKQFKEFSKHDANHRQGPLNPDHIHVDPK